MTADEGAILSRREGDVLVLTLDHPPSNALTAGMRAGLLAAMSDIGDARAIVLCGSGRNFCSTIPIDPDPALPDLSALCTAVENSPVPVIAALSGAVIGA
ncbi:MAG: enoyl-CoA hydratase/isomerase family protein, partial [Tabrizicola sp.]|nr:enoyl-CoA hydratase/isomerase family protein [Tabrizicola sp.]